eukprot:770413-Pelagomonas_calceolata.AAC.1
MGAGSFLKGKLGGVLERIAFKVDTGKGCVCGGVITLNSPMFGNDICAFVTRNSSMTFYLVEINRVKKGYRWQCESGPGEWQLLLQLIQPLRWWIWQLPSVDAHSFQFWTLRIRLGLDE